MPEALAPVTGAIPEFRFRPEHELLVCCARVRLTPDDRDRLRAIAGSGLEWKEVLWETERQSIVPFVYRHLHAECVELVPPHVLHRLREQYVRAAARSMSLAAELRAIIQLMEEHGIVALPYKGPVLALYAYGDIALRTFTDLDLLVRHDDVAQARELLGRRGYSTLEKMTPFQERAVQRLEHNIPLVNADGDIVVELHWRVARAAFWFPLPMEELWERTERVSLAGREVRAIGGNDLVLLLCVHGTRHAWSALEWISGVAELMRRPDGVDWNTVMNTAERLQVARTIRLGVCLANRLLGAPIPERVARWVDADPRMTGLMAWVAARLFAPARRDSARTQWETFRFQMQVKDGVRVQIRDGFRRLTSPSAHDWAAAALPDALFPLYHLIRPARLLVRYLRHAVQGERNGRADAGAAEPLQEQGCAPERGIP